MVVETIFQYRTLIGKCELGCGLDWEEIEEVTIIEHKFVLDRGKSGRRFKRDAINMSAILRGDRINDRVEIVEIGPGGLVATGAPFIARGEYVEVVLDVGDRSFRFRAIGVWLKDDGDDYRVGMAFVGVPICLHVTQLSEHEADLVDKISEAA
ncbi:MAG TPA: PilZ domain-containing protein [Kofleriaceae bacterium]|jgi:hypothetical protein